MVSYDRGNGEGGRDETEGKQTDDQTDGRTDKRDGRKVEKYDLFSGRPNAILKRDLYRIVGIIRKSQTS